jgi:hypothetical protein
MASDQIIINNYSKTGILLDELVVPNRSGDIVPGNTLASDADDKSWGAYRPVVFINGYYVDQYMDYFEFSQIDFLPIVRFSFTADDPMFISVNYPKDGDIASVYIRSREDIYKPIRMDFNILNVRSSQSRDPEGSKIRFTVLGETRIPGLYTEVSKAFRDMTSYDTLFEISQDLDLGFSSNDSELDDVMTWICPNFSYYKFMHEVSERSYKNDESYFKLWIDPYYNLTFVNLNNQLTAEDYVQQVKVIMGNDTANDTFIPGTQLDSQEMPLVLTNQKGSGDLPFFVNSFTLLSRSGNTANKYGYIQEVQFYDESVNVQNSFAEKYVKYTIETSTSENVGENQILQKGRVREDLYKTEVRKAWYGSLNNSVGGVHDNFIQALIQNEFNLGDLEKFTLRVELSGYYAGIYRGQAVPVLLYANKQGKRKENTGVSSDQKPESDIDPVLDRFLSGVYIVTSMEVKYETIRGMYQVLYLNKREWTLNSAGSFPKSFPINLLTG